ncbi:hypothetical protein L1987_18783 [Smallanthus sonchifolius]|uniref:Uncharacterized protein n=1 Tax=Smallanthus sonchifolius TaxID=185202 RepID=A0ACB9J1Q4_9ASTR|nr:hypothetical protein L1987_18783 [Smallanthus sonchifolius]
MLLAHLELFLLWVSFPSPINRISQAMNKKCLGGKSAGFDKSKLRCYNCKQLRHFKRKCPHPIIDTLPFPTIVAITDGQEQTEKAMEPANALVVNDFDWSNEIKEAQVEVCKGFMANTPSTKFMVHGMEASLVERERNDCPISHFKQTHYSCDDFISMNDVCFNDSVDTVSRNLFERFMTEEVPVFTSASTSQGDSQSESSYLSTRDSEESAYDPDRSVETSAESYNAPGGEANQMTNADKESDEESSTTLVEQKKEKFIKGKSKRQIKVPVQLQSSSASYQPPHKRKSFKHGFPMRTIDNAWHVDSGCSRRMTGLKDLLTDFGIIDGGYVAFSGDEKGGKPQKKELYATELLPWRKSILFQNSAII